MGLHVKAMVIDRERVFIGSMNFDPRSTQINSEMGVIVDSPGLAEQLARAMERDMAQDNAWRLFKTSVDGLPWWTACRPLMKDGPVNAGTCHQLFPRSSVRKGSAVRVRRVGN